MRQMFTEIPGFTRVNSRYFRLMTFKKYIMKIFFKSARRDECGRRVPLGEDTGGKTVMLRPLKFQCVGVWL
jgi:hypothetical protein